MWPTTYKKRVHLNIQSNQNRRMLFFFLSISYVYSSIDFPSIKLPHGGIFDWFRAFEYLKKPFNNSKIFGFTANTSEPDLNIIVDDIVNHMKLHNLNITEQIQAALNTYSYSPSKSAILQSSDICSEFIGNSYELCKKFNIKLNLDNIGIPQEHVNILLGNIVGYLPCSLFLIIVGATTIVFYIVQLFLCCCFFRPVESTKPNVLSIIFFVLADLLVLLSAIFYFFSFTEVNNLFGTLTSLHTIYPKITYSLADSFTSLVESGIPNCLGPVLNMTLEVTNTTHDFLDTTISSFLDPTTTALEKLVSKSSADMGVIVIFDQLIQPEARKFYEKANLYGENVPQNFFSTANFTYLIDNIQQLLKSEYQFADTISKINQLFEYIYSVLKPYQDYVDDLPNQIFGNTNKTIKVVLEELKNQTLEDSDTLMSVSIEAKEKNKVYRIVRVFYFIFGVVFIAAPFGFAIIFFMHNRCAICMASTVSVCPLVSTILIFVFTFVFTGVGYADLILSYAFEPSLDRFLNHVINRTIPGRTFEIPIINATQRSNEIFQGILNLTNVTFPIGFQLFEYFSRSKQSDGIANSLSIPQVLDLDLYATEVSTFIIDLGQNFTLNEKILSLLAIVRDGLKYVKALSGDIDRYFNWGVPMTESTNYLRNNITNSPHYNELNACLKNIDSYVDQMNKQYNIFLKQIYQELSDSLDQIDSRLSKYISDIMTSFGTNLDKLIRNIYPILNEIRIKPLIGPYAVVRNVIFYDLTSTSAFISLSGTLVMFGLVVVVILIWIRRKGMLRQEKVTTKPIELSDIEPNNDNIPQLGELHKAKSDDKFHRMPEERPSSAISNHSILT